VGSELLKPSFLCHCVLLLMEDEHSAESAICIDFVRDTFLYPDMPQVLLHFW
jgi:hypothetical protein